MDPRRWETLHPSRKAYAAGLSSAAVTIVVWTLSEFGVEVPSQVAAAIVTVVAFGWTYVVQEPGRSE